MKKNVITYRLAFVAVVTLLAATLMAAPKRSASGVSVTASVDSAMMEMGSRTLLHVKVDMPESEYKGSVPVGFPEIPSDEQYAEWQGVDVLSVDSTSEVVNGRHIDSYEILLQPFDPGTVTLEPLAVVTRDGADTAYSNVVTFKVVEVPLDSLQTINPIETVASPGTRWYDYIPNWLLWTLLAVAVVAGIVVTIVLAIKDRAVKEEEKRAPKIPPYDLAIRRLQTLRESKLPENGHEKEYYTELVDILRDYLQGRFGINAMEMTSTQIVKALRHNAETRMTADMMKSVLSIADFVKFAKVRPLPDDNVRAFNRAHEFVEQTKPAPEPEETQEEPKTSEPSNKKS